LNSRAWTAWGALYLALFFGVALIAIPGVFVWNLLQAGGDLNAQVFYGSRWGTQSLADVLPALILMMPIVVVAEVLAVRHLILEMRRRSRTRVEQPQRTARVRGNASRMPRGV
jgi:membrane protein implicated in regulation of membrane protease activity